MPPIRTLSTGLSALAIALVFALFAGPVSATDSSDLVSLINAYRSAPQSCDGKRTAAADPLVPNPVLVGGPFTANSLLQDVLKARGYLAASAYLIGVSGPPRASEVMKFIAPRHCASLSSPDFTEIGVARAATEWHIVLARRLLEPNLSDWREAGNQILRLTNAARAVPRTCGSKEFGAAPPLVWDDKLGAAGLAHSRDMANQDYAAHVAKDGSAPGDRVSRQGYLWRNVGENIAAGQSSAEQAISRWLSSPEHCANIMNGAFAEMGAAYALNPGSKAKIYWIQVFGRR